MLKHGFYSSYCGARIPFVYAILRDHCYYSCAKQPGTIVTSTINAAEDVIGDICAQEDIAFDDLYFFDLITYRGYPSMRSGFYRLVGLTLEASPERSQGYFVTKWRNDVQCPDEVTELFKDYIGPLDPSIKIWRPGEARAAGYSPTKMHSRSNGYWLSQIKMQDDLNEFLDDGIVRSPEFVHALRRFPQLLILVDHEACPESLRESEGERYCIWSLAVHLGN